MSSPLTGRFQDHYEVLGVEATAELSTIERAYFDLADKFDPRTPETADPENLEAVQLAFDVLSDPVSRAEFDQLRSVPEDKSAPKFNGLEFFEALGSETGLRAAVLCVLYDRRRGRPLNPGLSMRHLENILAAENEQLVFVLWYLKQRGLVSSDDKSNLQIDVEGMEYLEKNRPSVEEVMAWIRPTALAGPPKSAAPPAANESRRSAVDRILARGPN